MLAKLIFPVIAMLFTHKGLASEFLLKNRKTGKCLQVLEDGSVKQRVRSGEDGQIWCFEGGGLIRSKKTGMYLEVSGGNGDDDATIHLYKCTGEPWQRWEFEGDSLIKNRKTGKYLEVSGGNGEDNATVHQYNFTGTPWQRWDRVIALAESQEVKSEVHRIIDSLEPDFEAYTELMDVDEFLPPHEAIDHFRRVNEVAGRIRGGLDQLKKLEERHGEALVGLSLAKYEMAALDIGEDGEILDPSSNKYIRTMQEALSAMLTGQAGQNPGKFGDGNLEPYWQACIRQGKKGAIVGLFTLGPMGACQVGMASCGEGIIETAIDRFDNYLDSPPGRNHHKQTGCTIL